MNIEGAVCVLGGFMRISAGLALLFATGCFSKPGACPDATLAIPLANGDVQWSYDTSMGGLPLTQVDFTASLPAPCLGGFYANAAWNPKATSAPLEGRLSLYCVTSEGNDFRMSVGINDIASTAGSFTTSVTYSYRITGQSTTHTCDGVGSANITVRDPAGGPAPVPDIISPDFERTFDIHVDGTMPITGNAAGTPCSPISIELTTTVHVAAPDLESHPKKTCPSLG